MWFYTSSTDTSGENTPCFQRSDLPSPPLLSPPTRLLQVQMRTEDIYRNQWSPDSLDEVGECWFSGTDEEDPAASDRSPLSSVDAHTPDELRAIPLIRTPVEEGNFTHLPWPPLPPSVPKPWRVVSRLPVLSTKHSGVGQFLLRPKAVRLCLTYSNTQEEI